MKPNRLPEAGTPVEAVFTGTDSLGYRNGQTGMMGGAVVIRRATGQTALPCNY